MSASLNGSCRSWGIVFLFLPLFLLLQLNRSTELQGGRPCLQENERAVRIVLAMIGAFFVCWLPYTALSVVVVVDPELHIPPLVATMPMYFAKTSPVNNPIIYFLSNEQVCVGVAE